MRLATRHAVPASVLALAFATLPVITLASTQQTEAPKASTAPVPAGAYTLDKAHSSLVFRVSHLGFSSYVGRFTGFDAELQFDPRQLAASSVRVNIDPRSIQADNAPSGFMQTLAGKDWLDADQHPELSFRSVAVEPTGGNAFRIRGELTLHGQTRPVTLEARYNWTFNEISEELGSKPRTILLLLGLDF